MAEYVNDQNSAMLQTYGYEPVLFRVKLVTFIGDSLEPSLCG